MNTLNILVLAPHLEYPVLNGADILISNRIEGLKHSYKKTTVISMQWIEVFIEGQLSSKTKIRNRPRSKILSAAMAFFRRKSYLHEKFITRSYQKYAEKYLKNDDFSIVYYSFLFTAYAFRNKFPANTDTIQIIETHNFDIEWFANIKENSKLALNRIVAQISISFTNSFLDKYGNHYQFIALTNKDAENYAKFVTMKKVWTIPPGCNSTDIERKSKRDDSIKLIFVGSLGILSNKDALINFAENYFPFLDNKFEKRLKVIIIGSNPDNQINSICAKNKWDLKANLTSEELEKQYSDADFSILPFVYSAGFKLKLLESFANGVPVLATSLLKNQIDFSAYNESGIFSDDPKNWISFIEHAIIPENQNKIRNEVRKIAHDYSWENANSVLSKKINNILEINN